MSIVDKTLFMNKMKNQLATEVTAADQDKVLKILTVVLNNFDMSLTEFEQRNVDYLDAYVNALSVSGRSPKTVTRYQYELKRFFDFAKVGELDITVYHFREYLSYKKSVGISDNTLRGYRDIFTAYFRWLHREGMIPVDPTVNLIPIKVAKKVKVVFTELDIENLKSAATTIRDKAIICFLYSTGCRIGELCSLNRDDIDLYENECVVHGKGNKERTVYFDDITAYYLKTYLKSRKDFEDALFISTRTMKRFEQGGIRAMLNKVADVAHVAHVHPHKFRSSFATNKATHGMPIHELANIMGHEKVDTTMKYISESKAKIKASYQRYM